MLVVSLGKALNGTPPPLCDRQAVHPYFTRLQVADTACRKKTTLGYSPVAVRLVGGGATSHSRLARNGLPSFPQPNINEVDGMPYLHPEEEDG